VEGIQDAIWLVILRDDRWFLTEKRIHPVEVCVELLMLGVNWKDVQLILRLPSPEPTRF